MVNQGKIMRRTAAMVIQAAIIGALASLCGCAGIANLAKSTDHSQGQWESSFPNAFLWRRVKSDPLVFLPRAFPEDSPITPETGDWIVDPQDCAAFLVPVQECGGLSPPQWRAEAMKAVNALSKREQTLRNSVTVLVGWPAVVTLWGLCLPFELGMRPPGP